MDIPALYTPEDMTSGHGPWPPVGYSPPPDGASANVFINKKNVHRVGDKTLLHVHLPQDIHSDTISTGSKTVYVNKKPMAIIGSLLTSQYGPAGQVAAFGAATVFVDKK
jgi:uncharacterized Zn-binding protein involved in type VI secretion